MPRKGDSKYQVGNKFDSRYGPVTIIEYVSPKKLLVRFDESGYEYWTSSTRITSNELKDYSKSRIFGVGIVDVDYAVEQNPKNGPRVVCPYYRTWKNMLQRCYWNPLPSYIECSVIEEWFYFSNFKAWMEQQDWEGKHLDKDLLANGDKIYSPDTCCFISNEINQFIKDKSRKGDLPLGVSKSRNKYIAQGFFNGKSGYIGTFDTIEDAHKAWLIRKRQEAVRLAEQLPCERTKQALLQKYA